MAYRALPSAATVVNRTRGRFSFAVAADVLADRDHDVLGGMSADGHVGRSADEVGAGHRGHGGGEVGRRLRRPAGLARGRTDRRRRRWGPSGQKMKPAPSGPMPSPLSMPHCTVADPAGRRHGERERNDPRASCRASCPSRAAPLGGNDDGAASVTDLASACARRRRRRGGRAAPDAAAAAGQQVDPDDRDDHHGGGRDQRAWHRCSCRRSSAPATRTDAVGSCRAGRARSSRTRSADSCSSVRSHDRTMRVTSGPVSIRSPPGRSVAESASRAARSARIA